MEVEGGEGQEEEGARPGLQGRVARKVPGEEGPRKPQEGQEEGPALFGVGGPAPGGQVERGEGAGEAPPRKEPR